MDLSYLMTRSRLDACVGDEHRFLDPYLVTTWPLCPTNEKAKDDRQLIFHLHDDGTKHV